ncbi:MAG: response regulator [Acidimicrobiales bacterium]|nr:response regulator [Acidimicrobiales bacterium]MYD35037.1 response regulator [Acidimicrobiales bacterium]MYI08629.1 response regulator [Acidimicrobiales bacterium]
MTASVLVIDDHPVVIDGVRQLLAGQTEFTMIGEATNGVDGVALAKSLGPDLVLLDLKLGDSFAPHLCRLLADASRTSRIIIHTAFDDREPLRACLNAGAVGVVLKDAGGVPDLV